MIYSRSPGWQSPQEQKNVSPAPYPWRKLYSCKNKTFLGPTFSFPWSSGLSSLAALGRQLSCWSRKIKSCPSENLVPTRFLSFRVTLEEYIFPLQQAGNCPDSQVSLLSLSFEPFKMAILRPKSAKSIYEPTMYSNWISVFFLIFC